MSFCVVKIGGSLLENSREIVSNLVKLSSKEHGFLIIPGGGPMADLVRNLFLRYGLSQETAHWMAVLAMEQYAYFMAEGGVELTDDICKFSSGVRILLPYQALLTDDNGLEHNWDYTSDSVAAMISCRLGAEMVKVTDVDGIIIGGTVVDEISSEELLGKETCVDQGTLKILNLHKGNCLIINGTNIPKFVDCLIRMDGGTLIRG